MDIKSLFEKAQGGTLNYEQFMTLAQESGAKFADLSEGLYISKRKHDDEISAKNKEIDTLNGTITTRDSDLADLQKKLEEAGTDAEKLTSLSGDLTSLQSKYDADIKSYQEQLKRQRYEFGVKDFASTLKFTSSAAKRDFVQAMLAKELTMEKDKILGADDFVTAYKADNSDAFAVEDPKQTQQTQTNPLPQFVATTPGAQQNVQDPTGGFANAFHFTGVRPNPNQNNNK